MRRTLTRDIVIPEGTVFMDAPIKREMAEGHVEAVIPLNKDNTAFFTIDLVDAPDDLFEED